MFDGFRMYFWRILVIVLGLEADDFVYIAINFKMFININEAFNYCNCPSPSR